MIRSIIKDPLFLSRKAEPATIDDLSVAIDLKETLSAHLHECVGMAANMIGINKRIIIFKDDDQLRVMFNPEIIKVSKNTYFTEEGCLSHPGQSKKVKRYQSIKVSYLDENWKKKIKTYSGFTAEIIQHECDHLEGVLI